METGSCLCPITPDILKIWYGYGPDGLDTVHAGSVESPDKVQPRSRQVLDLGLDYNFLFWYCFSLGLILNFALVIVSNIMSVNC